MRMINIGLLADTTLSESLIPTVSMTLDMAGHEISYSALSTWPNSVVISFGTDDVSFTNYTVSDSV